VQGFKGIIVKLILPFVLFSSFSHTELSTTTWLIALVSFVINFLLFFYGQICSKGLKKQLLYPNTEFFMTGFEFGMLGVGLLGAIWGVEVLPLVMPVALGHEMFIWFYYIPRLNHENGEKTNAKEFVKQFFTTPTVDGILLGLLVNIAGLTAMFEATLVGEVIYGMIGFLTPVAGPLILIYIGYNLKFKGLQVKETIIYSVLRWIGVGVAMFAGIVIFRLIDPNLSPLFYAGFVGFLLLPPPFIIPLVIKEEKTRAFYTQLLLINTLVSFVGYTIALLVL
jgi:predicted permease